MRIRERMILAPGINGTELTTSLALHGVNTIGLQVISSAELAHRALTQSGFSIKNDFLSSREEIELVAEVLEDAKENTASTDPYFDYEHISYSAIREITASLRKMRSLVTSKDDKQEAQDLDNILKAGLFQKKNHALNSIYQNYMILLSKRDAVDRISLIRRAASQSGKMDAMFLTLEEYPLSPLEQSLLEQISEEDSRKRISLQELFGVKDESSSEQTDAEDKKNLHVDTIKNCYGASNEVEWILADIYSPQSLPDHPYQFPADQCTVAVTDTKTYGQLFFDYAMRYDIPVTFGCGIPITNSNPAILASRYQTWITSGFFSLQALKEMVFDQSFDKFKLISILPEKKSLGRLIDLSGKLGLRNNKTENVNRVARFEQAMDEEKALAASMNKSTDEFQEKLDCVPCLKIMAVELALPPEEFIKKYARIRKGGSTNAQSLTRMLDLEASKVIYEELKTMQNTRQNIGDLLSYLLKWNVLTQKSEPGKIHLTSIAKAAASLREHLYIAGLSASKYPGSPRENHLLLDDDLEQFGKGAEQYKSENVIRGRNRQLVSLVKLASSLGLRISVSFAGMNVSELKADNPSSLIYLLQSQEREDDPKAEDSKIDKIGYFDPEISGSRLVGKTYIERTPILLEDSNPVQATTVFWDPNISWSPSRLDTFFECPRRFMLRYLLGIAEPEERDPYKVIPENEFGTLAHNLMEALGTKENPGDPRMSKDEFIRLSNDSFDRYLMEHPPLLTEKVPSVRSEFLDMMELAYDQDPDREIILREKNIDCVHTQSGVHIHGFPDRVEKKEDGTYLIVDYKTGRHIKHQVNNIQNCIKTCLQVIIYAYIFEDYNLKQNNRITVSECEYRYLRSGQKRAFLYNDQIKLALTNRLEEFRNAVQNSCFDLCGADSNSEPCRYCKFLPVCGKLSNS